MKKFKGFTLVELIVVMAIMTILMAAIMQLMKPIRSTYVDSTYYENERNTQNGISQYISESVRYATNLGIYTDSYAPGGGASPSSISGVTGAIAQFKTETGITDETKINVITIDNKTKYNYNGSDFYGRLVRTKPIASGSYTADAAIAGTNQARLALGAAYYGNNTYSISLQPTSSGLKVQVSSIMASSLKSNTTNSDKDLSLNDVSGKTLVSTEADVVCMNVTNKVTTPGVFSTTYAGTTTTQGTNTYIVFTLPD